VPNCGTKDAVVQLPEVAVVGGEPNTNLPLDVTPAEVWAAETKLERVLAPKINGDPFVVAAGETAAGETVLLEVSAGAEPNAGGRNVDDEPDA